MSIRRSVVLLSGGLDSATTLAIAISQGFDCMALTCLYGQRHKIELEAARRVVRSMNVNKHLVMDIDLAGFGGSALTDPEIGVPKEGLESVDSAVPVTYVPARNTIFLSVALGWAEAMGAFDLFIGVNCHDYSGYPDCRPEFVEAFERLANLATAAAVDGRGRFQVHAPIIAMTKAQIIRRGVELGVDYGLTHSCYDPTTQGLSCGRCDSCRLRLRGFAQAGLKDPISYACPP